MQTITRLSIAFGAVTTFGWACSCIPNVTPCNTFTKTPVVVVGKVIRDSRSGFGTETARIAVEEVLHGLDAQVNEIDLDSGAGTRMIADDGATKQVTPVLRGAFIAKSADTSKALKLAR